MRNRLLLAGLALFILTGASFGRVRFQIGATDPSNPCDPIGFWINSTTGERFFCLTGTWQQTAQPVDAASITSGTVATARLGSGTANSSTYLRGDQTWAAVAGGSSQLHVPFHSDAGAAVTLTNQANAEQFLGNSNRNIQKVDLSGYTQARLLARVATVSASANTPRIYAEYHTAFSTTVGDYATLGTGVLNCSLFTGSTYCDTGWINLAANAKADVWVTVLQNGGDAAADPALGMVALQFK